MRVYTRQDEKHLPDNLIASPWVGHGEMTLTPGSPRTQTDPRGADRGEGGGGQEGGGWRGEGGGGAGTKS